jgi:hypothetical protein
VAAPLARGRHGWNGEKVSRCGLYDTGHPLPRFTPASLVLLLADVLHPIDSLPIELLLDRDMCHRRRRRCAVQCFSPGGNQITSPGRISSIGPPQCWARPQPAVTMRVWPRGCVCQAVRAPGSKVTLAPTTRAGLAPGTAGRCGRLDPPVKYLRTRNIQRMANLIPSRHRYPSQYSSR